MVTLKGPIYKQIANEIIRWTAAVNNMNFNIA